MPADRMARSVWWLVFLLVLSAPLLATLGVAAWGHAYPGTLRTAAANWSFSLIWLAAAAVAGYHLTKGHAAPRRLRSVARIVILLAFGLQAVALHFVVACESRPEHVGGPKPGTAMAQSKAGIGCP